MSDPQQLPPSISTPALRIATQVVSSLIVLYTVAQENSLHPENYIDPRWWAFLTNPKVVMIGATGGMWGIAVARRSWVARVAKKVAARIEERVGE